MSVRGVSVLAFGLVMAVPVVSLLAKGKSEQKVLPVYVVTAQTVAVMVDPGAGVDPEDPWANQVAQKDVETALVNWGRYMPMMSPQEADLVIVVRKGHGRLVNETINDPRQNNRAGVVNPTANGVQVGVQHGQNPDGSLPGQATASDEPPAPGGEATRMPPRGGSQTETGGVNDSFSVYQGHRSDPWDWAPAWRRDEKNGLHSHDVPVVDEFRKAVAEADKAVAAAKKP